MSPEFESSCHGKPFMIDAPAGALECLCTRAEQDSGRVAVICHPHPQHGGTMTNKVVHTLARSFNEMQIDAVRFNFRGVGNSTGEYDQAIGEIDDLLAVVDWVRQKRPGVTLWLAGFSFGAYIAAAAAARVEAGQLVTVAPAINLLDFDTLSQPGCPWLLIQGDADEIVPPQQVIDWAARHPAGIDVATLEGAGHFFHGRLNDLRDVLLQNLGFQG